ncbi:hypothetical protein KTU01_26720 [Kocuria turfanensis]|uniref:Uncharacterized protein n=1 Tax=Kocuria turfanensis TaxID=388357 RepID=A0A512IFS1_9MICC|nr:hypothetical protein KTU01_26720 [Kocuria turfanensis]
MRKRFTALFPPRARAVLRSAIFDRPGPSAAGVGAEGESLRRAADERTPTAAGRRWARSASSLPSAATGTVGRGRHPVEAASRPIVSRRISLVPPKIVSSREAR